MGQKEGRPGTSAWGSQDRRESELVRALILTPDQPQAKSGPSTSEPHFPKQGHTWNSLSSSACCLTQVKDSKVRFAQLPAGPYLNPTSALR